jgi:hypothetical protein
MGSIKSGLFLLLMVLTGFAKAQGLGDWFNQAGEQKRYYLQQIAAYQAFAAELKQGYGVVQHGLGGIRDINTAELVLHTAYYQSLRVASPAVKNNVQVRAVLEWERLIVLQFSAVSFAGLLADEQQYVVAVRATVFKACDQDLNDLSELLAAGGLQMSDGERLKRLGLIHAAMLDKYEFTQSFIGSVRLLVLQRQKELNDVQTLKKLP